MSYLIKASTKVNIEATGKELIIQNICNILRTVKGEIPLHRNFGLDGTNLDKPILKVKASIMKDILTNIEEFIGNEVTVKSITFDSDINGIYPIVEVVINE